MVFLCVFAVKKETVSACPAETNKKNLCVLCVLSVSKKDNPRHTGKELFRIVSQKQKQINPAGTRRGEACLSRLPD